MRFENIEIHSSDLPDFKSVDLESIQKRYKKQIWLNELAVFILLFAIPIVSLFFDAFPKWIPLTALIILSIVFILRSIEIEKGFPLKKFGVRQHDMIYQSGFFHFTETVVPYNRIQHVEIKQGPLSRLFSLYSLRLYTAGASSGDLIIDGLEKSTAQKLKAKVLDKTTVVDGTN
ncbi:PH domain-containing protein [Psychroflexus sp. CAK57W]|uniref:PH domain-containing protein n=1 Tax=Psychroflexus curvus TaxID=2873595 RepID=UPI001CCA126B|nr:PH domain-containing protein [Psychroflexus curvus]MBZ9626714.1 PH domain-containing protein [Psychroflexus curvus]MBZ9786490.1 PH domain-containing protein [Psychroflexus curvus]